jgi:hypothetical protein
MLSVIMLHVILLNGIILNVILLNGVILNVVALIVMGPFNGVPKEPYHGLSSVEFWQLFKDVLALRQKANMFCFRLIKIFLIVFVVFKAHGDHDDTISIKFSSRPSMLLGVPGAIFTNLFFYDVVATTR